MSDASSPKRSYRWIQLVFGLVLMVSISSPQYVWALFTGPYRTKLGASLAEVQVVFSILLGLQCFLAPFNGWLLDRFGVRKLLVIGVLLTGASWVLAAGADTLWSVYLLYGGLGGLGTGIVYIGVVGLVVRWFPDRRGCQRQPNFPQWWQFRFPHPVVVVGRDAG
jgi:MFS transporter, OFA family, oxalate/formate antiporter